MYPERKIDIQKLEEDIRKTGKVIVEHETAIIGKIFEKGKISGTTDTQLINFVQSRVDMCLNNLDIESIFKPTYNPIAKWFYNNINGSKMHDFFARQGNEYNRKWVKSKFIW
jgi:ribonucleotide reductase beta subunit family protein with ferritin-like domain